MSQRANLQPGDVLAGTWRLESVLREGASGPVFLASDLRLGRQVAVKALNAAALDALSVARLEREAAVLARLSHPNVVSLHMMDRHQGVPYLVLQFIEGQTLAERVLDRGGLSEQEVLAIADQACDALAYLHDQGLLHRDLKPSNLMLSRQGHLTLIDLGITRSHDSALTRTGVVHGTPGYMSPEAIVGEKHLDGRADQYSLAAVLFELLTGSPPFSGLSGEALLRAHLTQPRPKASALRPGLPNAVSAVLARAMALQPDGRYRSVRDFHAAFRAALEPVVAGAAQEAATLPGREALVPGAAPDATVPGREALVPGVTPNATVPGREALVAGSAPELTAPRPVMTRELDSADRAATRARPAEASAPELTAPLPAMTRPLPSGSSAEATQVGPAPVVPQGRPRTRTGERPAPAHARKSGEVPAAPSQAVDQAQIPTGPRRSLSNPGVPAAQPAPRRSDPNLRAPSPAPSIGDGPRPPPARAIGPLPEVAVTPRGLTPLKRDEYASEPESFWKRRPKIVWGSVVGVAVVLALLAIFWPSGAPVGPPPPQALPMTVIGMAPPAPPPADTTQQSTRATSLTAEEIKARHEAVPVVVQKPRPQVRRGKAAAPQRILMKGGVRALKTQLLGEVLVTATFNEKPVAALVEVDGILKGQTPLPLSLPPGTHVLRLDYPRAMVTEFATHFLPGKATRLEVELPTAAEVAKRARVNRERARRGHH